MAFEFDVFVSESYEAALKEQEKKTMKKPGQKILAYIILALVVFGFYKVYQYTTVSGALVRDVNTVQLESIHGKFEPFLDQYALAGGAMVAPVPNQYGYAANGPIVAPASTIASNADIAAATATPASSVLDMKAIIIACKDGDKLPDGTLFSYSAGKEPPFQLFKIDPLYFSLPAGLAAAEPGEVNTVIKVIWYEYAAETYTDGCSYCRQCARVMIVDLDSNAVLGVTDVQSDDHAPETKYTNGNLYSGLPGNQICEYVQSIATGKK
jgi:hypothetical protein